MYVSRRTSFNLLKRESDLMRAKVKMHRRRMSGEAGSVFYSAEHNKCALDVDSAPTLEVICSFVCHHQWTVMIPIRTSLESTYQTLERKVK